MSINQQVKEAMADERAPEGTIIINRRGFDKLYYIEDLAYMKELAMGQLFFAVARHHNKKPAEYGAKWIKFRTPQGEVSNQFMFMQDELNKLANDLERANMICKHLGEPELSLGE